ncbi:thioredoxin family protein [Nubsella zeaxanthinifaciens]|jgi:thioredoxin-related protein|uniref:thioredoxin family protein n=1 Tax=Nubsella zeaxanthinifaciens TaxID=392412 RepID=UPI000DE48FC8|nr:thioredoxin family protein [Nubsella zeaxanthinifaciens]
MKKLTIILIALLTSQLCFAQIELDKALIKAKKENKLVFVDTYFTGCIPCEQMDREVFPNTAVSKTLAKNFVMLKVNVFTEKLGDTIKTQHILNGFPTFLVLNGAGNLVASVAGFKDPGDLITFLNFAKSKADKGLIHAGYSATYNEKNYPAFYVEFAKTRKGINAANLKEYSDALKDFKATNSLLPFLIARSTNEKVSEQILKDYDTYASLYGEEVLQPVVDKALLSKLQANVNSSSSNNDFETFLSSYKRKFPADRWKINLQTLGSKFYLEMKKDTAAYLGFAIKNPVLYQYHFTALANTMIAKKQLNGAMGTLLLQWANAIVDENSSMEIIKNAASLNKQLGNNLGYQKMMQLAINRAKKYEMPYQELEASLKAASK